VAKKGFRVLGLTEFPGISGSYGGGSAGNCLLECCFLIVVAPNTSEMSVDFQQIVRRSCPQDGHLHVDCPSFVGYFNDAISRSKGLFFEYRRDSCIHPWRSHIKLIPLSDSLMSEDDLFPFLSIISCFVFLYFIFLPFS
jgi:hypothetical protein